MQSSDTYHKPISAEAFMTLHLATSSNSFSNVWAAGQQIDLKQMKDYRLRIIIKKSKTNKSKKRNMDEGMNSNLIYFAHHELLSLVFNR